MTQKRVFLIDSSTVSHHAIITSQFDCPALPVALTLPLPSLFRRLPHALALDSILPWP
jgi:hypothetical protein